MSSKIDDIFKATGRAPSLFDADEVRWMEDRLFQKKTKKGPEWRAECFIRKKEIKITPEEVVRQLCAHRLVERFGYDAQRLAFEFTIWFGREAKRADIAVLDKDDPNVPYIIVETKKPTAKDGREQLRSYTLATGATMAVWTNGEAVTCHQRKNPNFFEDIPGIPRADQTLADILNKPFTLADLIREDKLTQTGKSLKDLVLEMEDEVLANAGVDVFEEVFKLIFAKLYDEKTGATHPEYNLRFRNSGQSDIQLKEKIEKLFKEACDEWPGVFDANAAIALTPPHLSICVSSLETVKLFNSNLDVVDDAFEYLMNKSSKGEKGQYFTPRYVIDMCVRMLNPKPTDSMIDTAAGSSGFPVHTIFHVWRQMQLDAGRKVSHLFTSAPKGKEEIDYVRNKVFAIDFDEKTVRVARTLNLIAGDGHTNVLHLNSLDYGRWNTVTKETSWIDTYNDGWKKFRKHEIPNGEYVYFDFDIVMANPPFAGEIKEGQILSHYDFGSKGGKPLKSVGRDILFIERNINFLGAGGRMAIVLPQGRFNNATDQYIRRYIAERCRILAVVGLGGNTFKPHTGTKTSVLFVQKWQNDKSQPNYNPKRGDYPIFFATQRREGKNSRGDKLYWTKDKTGTTTDTKLALCDQYGHPVVHHDLFATYNYVWDEETNTNRLERLTPDGIAEAFAQFAAKEGLTFFR